MNTWLEAQFSLKGKRALVTGASKGIGAEIAIDLSRAGAEVILLGRTEISLSSTVQTISKLDGVVSTIICDLSDPVSISSVLSKVESLGVDILVNNAGMILRDDALEVSLENWNVVIQTNITSLFQFSQAVARSMVRKNQGRIINIASLLSFQGGIRVPAYAASKHAVAGLTKALANEWSAHGINVNAIAPGYIETDNTEPLRQDPVRSASILERIPIKRWGTTSDISSVAVFLAAPASRYISGEIIVVDGGWMAR